MSLICIASSRVGLRIQRLDARLRLASTDSSTGRAKARVLPVPVWAVATMSRPESGRDGLALARALSFKAVTGKVALQGRGQRKFRKSFHSKCREGGSASQTANRGLGFRVFNFQYQDSALRPEMLIF